MQWLPVILILPYFLLLLKLYRSLLKIDTFNAVTDPATFVSVVVACRNEQKALPILLTSIAEQSYPGNLYELIIVDDGSTDKTYEMASEFESACKILTLKNKGKGKKQALRTGIIAAKGNLIITTDADCRMGKNWIRIIASFYEQNKPDMIICPVQLESSAGILMKMQELEYLSLQGITAGSAISGEATMCNGANLSFTREAYLSHSYNLHDEIDSGDDIFFLHSLKKQNAAKILWLESRDALVITQPPSTIRSFLKQRSRWILKGKSYNDLDTIVLGIVTFITISLQISYFTGMLFYPDLTGIFLAILILKSVPDFLILMNASRRYDRKNLMLWFVPAQLIYPFYVLSVVFYSFISGE